MAIYKGYSRNQQERRGYRQAWAIYGSMCRTGQHIGYFLGRLRCNATGSLHKIFALLGLSDECSRSSSLLQPDYSMSVVDVYTNATRYLIRNGGTVAGLSYLFEMVPEPCTGIEENVPSWVVLYQLYFDLDSIGEGFFNSSEDTP